MCPSATRRLQSGRRRSPKVTEWARTRDRHVRLRRVSSTAEGGGLGPHPGGGCSAGGPRGQGRFARARTGQSRRSGRRLTMEAVLRRLRIENLVLIREAELELDPGLNAITGETGAGKTILANAFGLLLGARGEAPRDRAGRRRGLRRGRVRPRRRRRARNARRAAARGRGLAPRCPADLRRRAHARIRVGPQRRARGRRRRGRKPARDERAVRAAAACAARLPARRPRLVRRLDRPRTRGAPCMA